jgi:hypothetical protein
VTGSYFLRPGGSKDSITDENVEKGYIIMTSQLTFVLNSSHLGEKTPPDWTLRPKFFWKPTPKLHIIVTFRLFIPGLIDHDILEIPNVPGRSKLKRTGEKIRRARNVPGHNIVDPQRDI